jgi:hypothetical protein
MLWLLVRKVRASFSLTLRPVALKMRLRKRLSSGFKKLAWLTMKSLPKPGLSHAITIRRSLSGSSLVSFAKKG